MPGTRERILLAARDILGSTDDPADLTVAALAARSGLSRTALYRHFPGMEALTVQVALSEYARFEAGQAAELARIPDPHTRLRRRLDSGIAWALANPGLYRCIGRAFRSPGMVEPYRSATSLRQVGIGPLVDDVGAVLDSPDPVDELPAAVIWTHPHGYISTVLDLPPALQAREPRLREVFLDLQLSALATVPDMDPAAEPVAAPTSADVVPAGRATARERLLAAAAALLAEHGETETITVRRLADAAKVSPASVYLGFADRDAILVELAESDRTAWLRRVDARLRHVVDPLDRVMTRLRLDVQWAVERPLLFEILWLGARPASGHRSSPDGRGTVDGWVAYRADLAALATGSGVDPEDLAVAVWADLRGFLSLTLVTPDFPWPPASRLHRAFVRMERTALISLLAGPGSA